MPFLVRETIQYYAFNSFEAEGLTHALYTRHGGFSPAPWNSLNFGGTVGDDPHRVVQNHDIAFNELGFSRQEIFDVWQVHDVGVVFADRPRLPGESHKQADIILTDHPKLRLFMRFADCVPILLYDPHKRIVGIAHAGWQGTVKGVANSAIKAMQQRYQSNPRDILAAIGPSIGPDHYEVGPEVVQRISERFGTDASGLIHQEGGSTFLDLWMANQITLEQAGVQKIEIAEICTACHHQDWFSHRLSNGKTGRFGVMIALDT